MLQLAMKTSWSKSKRFSQLISHNFLLTLRAQDVLHSNKTRIKETNTQVQYCIVEFAAESYKDINVQGTTLV